MFVNNKDGKDTSAEEFLELALNTENVQEKEKYCEKARNKTFDMTTLKRVGDLYYQMGNYSKASSCYTEVVTRNRVSKQMDDGEFIEMCQSLGLIILSWARERQANRNGKGNYGYICLEGRANQYLEAAETFFSYILEVDPENTDSLLYKGVLNLIIQTKGVVGMVNKSLKKDMEWRQTALECFDKVLENDPHNELAWMFKGDSLLALYDEERVFTGDLIKNLDEKDKAIERIRQKRAEWDEVMKCYDKALELNPQNVFTLERKCTLLLVGFGDIDNATNCFHRIFRLDPEVTINNYNLLEQFRHTAVLGPQDHAIQMQRMVGYLYFLQSDYGTAAEYFDQVIDKWPEEKFTKKLREQAKKLARN